MTMMCSDIMKKSKIAQREEPFRDALLKFLNIVLSTPFDPQPKSNDLPDDVPSADKIEVIIYYHIHQIPYHIPSSMITTTLHRLLL